MTLAVNPGTKLCVVALAPGLGPGGGAPGLYDRYEFFTGEPAARDVLLVEAHGAATLCQV